MISCDGSKMSHSLYLTLNAAEKYTQFLISSVDSNSEINTENTFHAEAQILYSEMSTQAKASTEFLIPAIDKACQKLGISINDINHIAAVIGPGNFMGIRLTAVTAVALKRVLPKHSLLAPINYMQCLAQNLSVLSDYATQYVHLQKNDIQSIDLLTLLRNIKGKVVRVITTATKNSVHLCDFTFQEENGQIFPSPNFSPVLYDFNDEIEHMSHNTIEKSLQKKTNTILMPDFLIGSGLSTHENFFIENFPHAICITEKTLHSLHTLEKFSTIPLVNKIQTKDYFEIPLPLFAYTPSIQALHRLTISMQISWQKEDISPLYIKACDAIQNLDHIANMQGRDPKKAHAHLKKLMNIPL